MRTRQSNGVYLLSPLAIIFLTVPVVALVLRVPWGSFLELLTQPETLQAAGLSIATSLGAALICVIVGTALALWLSEQQGAWATALRVVVIIPLVLPPLIGGVALLSVFGARSPVGQFLATIGVYIPFSTTAVILAQVFVALPFMVLTVEAALRSRGSAYGRIARELGASPWTVLTRVTLPLVKPAIIAGALLSFARALGEYGATSLFAGSTPGVSRTLPQAIAAAFQGTAYEESTGYVMAGLLVLIAVVVVVISGLWRQPRKDGAGGLL